MVSLIDPKSLELVEDDPNLEDLLNMIHSFAKSPDDIFQFDFLRDDQVVVRIKTSERSWKKVAEGNWSLDSLLELVGRGLVVKQGYSAMGWEVRPRPEILGSL